MESIANDTFLTRVLSWNKQDYMNEGFYKNRIQKISKRFKTKEEYYESFIFPFYDDVKCMIAAEWKSLGTKSQFITGEIVVLNVSVSMHGSFVKVSSDIDYTKIFVDDLVYLTISDSFSLNDSDQNYLICYVSAIVQETMENSFISSKNTSKKNYVLQTILSKNMPEYDLLNDSKVQWKIAKIASITSCLRIDYALSKKVDFELLQSIMDPKRIHVKVEKEKFNALKRKLEQITIKTGSLLNEYQKDAIINAVSDQVN